MSYRVALRQSEEGFAVWVPALPGCCSQGETRAEALENIAEAIKEYLAALDDAAEEGVEFAELEVAA